jgi:hypothetical protein
MAVQDKFNYLFMWPFRASAVNIADFAIQISIRAILALRFARMQISIEAQSTPVEKFENREVPCAKAAGMPYRWPRDLSPGRRRLPKIFLAGRMSVLPLRWARQLRVELDSDFQSTERTRASQLVAHEKAAEACASISTRAFRRRTCSPTL